MTRIALLANLGAEEGSTPPPASEERLAAARLAWRVLFDREALWLGEAEPAWPPLLPDRATEAAFPWLPGGRENTARGLVPWLPTRDAAARANDEGLPLCAAPPEAVATVHDKAFTARFCAREGFDARPLRGLRQILEPAAMGSGDGLRAAVQTAVVSWPEWARAHFVIKPRFGTSGRGRIAASGSEFVFGDAAARRLLERGGAIVEPWLDDRTDLSAQLWVPAEADADVVFAASLRAWCSPAGAPLGHRGEIDSRGRVFSGQPEEEALRELGAALANAARAEGFHGPVGVDALAFEHGGRSWLQPLELNARYTLGLCAAGLARRALPEFRERLGLAPGDRHGVAVLFIPAPGLWERIAAVEGSFALGFGAASPATGAAEGVHAGAPPIVVGAREPAALDRLLAPTLERSDG